MFSRVTLAACPSCSCQFFVNEPACPHCGAVVRQGDGHGAQRTAATLLLGLAVAAVPLAACGDDTGGNGGAGGGSGGATASTSASSTATSTANSTATGDGGAGDGGDISVQSAYGIAPSVGPGGGSGDGGFDSTGGFGAGGFEGTGGGSDVVCNADVVADESECDAGCDAAVYNDEGDILMCSITCTVDEDCIDDGSIVCVDFGDGNTACVYDCSGDNACPNNDFVCDESELLCLPDSLTE